MTNSNKQPSLLLQSISGCKSSGYTSWHNTTLLDVCKVFENWITMSDKHASLKFHRINDYKNSGYTGWLSLTKY